MTRHKRWVAAALVASLALSALACGTTVPVIDEKVTLTPAPVTTCEPTISPAAGAFQVEPEATSVCLQPPQIAWSAMSGSGKADWKYGVGTFLDGGATVYFPGDEGYLVLQEQSEIKLPDGKGLSLKLIAGTINVWWKKVGAYISAILAGGDALDPDFAVFSVSYDPSKEITELQVYGGQAIVTRQRTGQVWQVAPWQRLSLQPTEFQVRAIIAPPSASMTALLQKEGLPVTSPWQLDPYLDRDPILDPIRATDSSSQQVLAQLMEGLFRIDGAGNVVPGGAEGLEVSDDGLVYTFYLRQDALWSDGEPVLSHQYVDAVCRAADPSMKVPEAELLYFIAGLEAFHQGRLKSCGQVGINAVDDYTLVIQLEQPLADVASQLVALPLTYPLRFDLIERCGDSWTEPECYVGNGPYTISSWIHGESIILEKNPLYWNASQVEPDVLEFIIRTD